MIPPSTLASLLPTQKPLRFFLNENHIMSPCCSNPSNSSPFQSSKSQNPHTSLQGLTGFLLPPPFLLWSHSLLTILAHCSSHISLAISWTHAPVSRLCIAILLPVSQIVSSSLPRFKSLPKCYYYFVSKSSKSILLKIVGYHNHICYSLAKCIFSFRLIIF